jgi:glycosyltransferase involved in cell wall biosynthesis/2-polyprenyl-3-methyl-5-hydroxy-6-metoxy-1,4-benzoquinol methylase
MSFSCPSCWCGNPELERFSSEYLHCRACETLVLADPPTADALLVTDDDIALYGRNYFERMAERHGLPTLEDRARFDLQERCLYWLRSLLRYRQPPARILELGSAHGAFVAMMRWAGFDATGLDLSPELVERARRRFEVPILEGPIESHDLPEGSMDAVVLMDVLEHLAQPEETLRQCFRLLKPDGLFFLQTPQYREGKSLAQMQEEDDPFVRMLLPDQHLYLFSQSSVRLLLRRLGAEHVVFEPAIFSGYDMSLIAGRTVPPALPESVAVASLQSAPAGRLVLALRDLDDRFQELSKQHAESEADRAARLRNLQAMEELFAKQAAEHARQNDAREADAAVQAAAAEEMARSLRDLDDRFQELSRLHAESEADRAARLRNLQAMEALFAKQAADHARHNDAREAAAALQSAAAEEVARSLRDLDDRFQELSRLHAESEVDRAARVRNLQAMEELFAKQATDHARHNDAREAEIARLAGHVQDLQMQVEEREARIEKQAIELRTLRETTLTLNASLERYAGEAAALAERCQELRGQTEEQRRALQSQESLLARLRLSYVFRLMRAFRLWGWLARNADIPIPHSTRAVGVPTLRKIVIDLTPVLPGGENGGAKVMTLELIRNLARLAPDKELILLTAAASHDELASLDAANIRRICVHEPAAVLRVSDSLALRARSFLSRFVPENLLARIGGAYRKAIDLAPVGGSLLSKLQADLLFCPFTAPFFFDATVPTVSVIYDLQHVYYPQFFNPADIQERDRNFRKAVRVSSRIVCISEYVRGTVLTATKMDPERLKTIYILLPRRLANPKEDARSKVLKKWGLTSGQYLLYPANFWPHKNHEMLLTAFAMFRSKQGDSGLKLVLTGALGIRAEYVRTAAVQMGIADHVLFPGYVPEEELSALLHSCAALIFPSLFEGFGMPLLEAMAAGKPLLCANGTSLPEVAGDAALFFDPRKPADIAAAIARFENEPKLRLDLAAKSAKRLSAFGGAEEMAAEYLKIFEDAVREPNLPPPGVYGSFADGWLGERSTIAVGPGRDLRKLRLVLSLPEWVPVDAIPVRVAGRGSGDQAIEVLRGSHASVERDLGTAGDLIEVLCAASFQPSSSGHGTDPRYLTCLLHTVEIVEAHGVTQALQRREYEA